MKQITIRGTWAFVDGVAATVDLVVSDFCADEGCSTSCEAADFF